MLKSILSSQLSSIWIKSLHHRRSFFRNFFMIGATPCRFHSPEAAFVAFADQGNRVNDSAVDFGFKMSFGVEHRLEGLKSFSFK